MTPLRLARTAKPDRMILEAFIFDYSILQAIIPTNGVQCAQSRYW